MHEQPSLPPPTKRLEFSLRSLRQSKPLGIIVSIMPAQKIVQLDELEEKIALLRRDYSKLNSRIRHLEHSIKCECDGVTLRLNFPAFRQGQATVYELIETIIHFLPAFALPRTRVQEVRDQYGKITAEEYEIKISQLRQEAIDLFKKAQKATNRNGEAGELLLYLLTEWILGAPQLIAKMSLKTNPEMPVHGADGVHVRYCGDTSRLLLYWGESKLYTKVGAAISAAIESIAEALKPEKLDHELKLVSRNIDFAGLDIEAKSAILAYLDPMEETYNERLDVTTCLIGFDFAAFQQITAADGEKAEEKFRELAKTELERVAKTAAEALKAAGLEHHTIEMFFFPVPSVQRLRDTFQDKIGWTP